MARLRRPAPPPEPKPGPKPSDRFADLRVIPGGEPNNVYVPPQQDFEAPHSEEIEPM